MDVHVVKEDLTLMKVDAIVNAANALLFPGGGVSGSIFAKGGEKLKEEAQQVRENNFPDGLPLCEPVTTTAYNLPSKYIIHVVGPVYGRDNLRSLKDCYKKTLALADEKGFTSIAFPALSTGVFGVPVEQSADYVKEVLDNYVSKSLEDVYLVVNKDKDYAIYQKRFG